VIFIVERSAWREEGKQSNGVELVNLIKIGEWKIWAVTYAEQEACARTDFGKCSTVTNRVSISFVFQILKTWCKKKFNFFKNAKELNNIIHLLHISLTIF
jgi:hypothetical protein